MIEHPNVDYVTLSHHWVGADFLKLTEENMHSMKTQIPCLALIHTFQGAIPITRFLGYRCIWIYAP